MVLPISYFPPISWFKALLLDDSLIELHENYTKQTLRNRCQIATANGVQRLSVPVTKAEKTVDVLIASHDNWQQKQWNAISTAYGESAFFDYYADDLKPFFTPPSSPKSSSVSLASASESPHLPSKAAPVSLASASECSNRPHLFAHNIAIIRKLLELMDINHELRFTDSFVGETYTQAIKNSHSQSVNLEVTKIYYQVFREKIGFVPDLSILDLLFNLGPESACYLCK